MEKKTVETALEKEGIEKTVRGETLHVEEIVSLYDRLRKEL